MKTQIVSSLILLSACGSGQSDVASQKEATQTNQPNITYLYETKSLLPLCSVTNQNQLAYVRTDNSFFTCEPTGWNPITVKGEKGDTPAPVPTQIPFGILKKYTTTGGEDEICKDSADSYLCYIKDIQFTEFPNKLFHYSIVLYDIGIGLGYSDADTMTYTGFTKPDKDGSIFVSLLLHDTPNNGPYSEYWIMWDQTDEMVLASDTNNNGEIEANEILSQYHVD